MLSFLSNGEISHGSRRQEGAYSFGEGREEAFSAS